MSAGSSPDGVSTATTEVSRGLDLPSRPPGSGEADGGRTVGTAPPRPLAPLVAAPAPQPRLARLSQERLLALAVVALLVMLSGVGAAVLARRGDERAGRVALVDGPVTTAGRPPPTSRPGSATTADPGGEAPTTITTLLDPAAVIDRFRTPAVTSRNQAVATPDPGGPVAGRPPTGAPVAAPAGERAAGGPGPSPAAGGGTPVDPRGVPDAPPDAPARPGPAGPPDPVVPSGPDAPADPGGVVGPCTGRDYLPVVELSSVRDVYRSGESVELNVGVRNVSDHDCGPPPAPSLVVTTDAGAPVDVIAVTLPLDAGAHVAPAATVRQPVTWSPPLAGAYRLQVDLGGTRSDPLALLVE
jgi:hypothetical protein